MALICPKCGDTWYNSFCTKCGTKKISMPICHKCGDEIWPHYQNCRSCGISRIEALDKNTKPNAALRADNIIANIFAASFSVLIGVALVLLVLGAINFMLWLIG